MVPNTRWMGTLLVAAFIQSELQCIVLPNQQIRIEFAGGCQKVSTADERGFPLFTAPTELPFCARQPIISLWRSGSAAGCALKMSDSAECELAGVVGTLEAKGSFLRTGESGQFLAASHFNDIPPWHLWPTADTNTTVLLPYPRQGIVGGPKPKSANEAHCML